MLAFLDTEFTDLVIFPRLLSVGIVTDGDLNQDFYAEVTNRDRIEATNWFGLENVLPQFGKIANAACSYADLGTRLAVFFGELMVNLDADEVIEIAYGYQLDWELVDQAINDSELNFWKLTRHRVRPVNVYTLTGFGQGKLATETYFNNQSSAPFSRHHALCDARALRLAYKAAMLASAASGLSTIPSERHFVGF